MTFAPGQPTKTLTIGVKGDTTREGNEVFFVNLKQATGANLADAQGQGTILNDDGLVLTLADVALTEGHSGIKNALVQGQPGARQWRRRDGAVRHRQRHHPGRA
ncbi:MAG: hypothetical protein IPN92_11090 [Chromatiaceae bacterium]|nr:hypothetical protein [Chromatiaceae bacterium]